MRFAFEQLGRGQDLGGAGLFEDLPFDLRQCQFGLHRRRWPVPMMQRQPNAQDNQRRRSTGLAGYLREKGVTEVYCCGVAGDICVYYTLNDALRLGFTAVLIEDASRPLDQKNYEAAKNDIAQQGGRIILSTDLE